VNERGAAAPAGEASTVTSIRVTDKGLPAKRVPVKCVAVEAESASLNSTIASYPAPSGLVNSEGQIF